MATKAENVKYWREREAKFIGQRVTDDKKLGLEAAKRFDVLAKDISDQVTVWLDKYAGENGITLAEAKKRVSTADIDSLSGRIKKVSRKLPLTDPARTDLRLYNLTMKVNRLEYLKAEMGLTVAEFYGETSEVLYKSFYQAAMDEYERLGGEYLGFTAKHTTRDIKELIQGSLNNSPDSANWSDRLWGASSTTYGILVDQVTKGIILGENPRKVAARVKKSLNTSRMAAERLARTEMARIQTEQSLNAIKDMSVSQYIFVTQGNACDICKSLDGKTFRTTNLDNIPPLHPNCRCAISPYLDRDEYEAEMIAAGHWKK